MTGGEQYTRSAAEGPAGSFILIPLWPSTTSLQRASRSQRCPASDQAASRTWTLRTTRAS